MPNRRDEGQQQNEWRELVSAIFVGYVSMFQFPSLKLFPWRQDISSGRYSVAHRNQRSSRVEILDGSFFLSCSRIFFPLLFPFLLEFHPSYPKHSPRATPSESSFSFSFSFSSSSSSSSSCLRFFIYFLISPFFL